MGSSRTLDRVLGREKKGYNLRIPRKGEVAGKGLLCRRVLFTGGSEMGKGLKVFVKLIGGGSLGAGASSYSAGGRTVERKLKNQQRRQSQTANNNKKDRASINSRY